MSKAFPRVRDRKIIHWAIDYLGGAWCVLQLLAVLERDLRVVFPLFSGPSGLT
jgi:hypothetical protein